MVAEHASLPNIPARDARSPDRIPYRHVSWSNPHVPVMFPCGVDYSARCLI
jgi:hypothetical protein